MRKMNLGCGPIQPKGWVNVDNQPQEGLFKPCGMVQLDARGGPTGSEAFQRCGKGLYDFEAGSFDVVFMNHSLQQFTHNELGPLMHAIHRLLCKGGQLRVSVPDVVTACRAYLHGISGWFPNQEGDLDQRLAMYLTWYSSARTLFTPGYLQSVMQIVGATHTLSPIQARIGWDLADRFSESLFMEAVKR